MRAALAATGWDTRLLNATLRTTGGAYGRLAMPAVILVGDRDRGWAEPRRLAREVPGAEPVALPGAGHRRLSLDRDVRQDLVGCALGTGPP